MAKRCELQGRRRCSHQQVVAKGALMQTHPACCKLALHGGFPSRQCSTLCIAGHGTAHTSRATNRQRQELSPTGACERRLCTIDVRAAIHGFDGVDEADDGITAVDRQPGSRMDACDAAGNTHGGGLNRPKRQPQCQQSPTVLAPAAGQRPRIGGSSDSGSRVGRSAPESIAAPLQGHLHCVAIDLHTVQFES